MLRVFVFSFALLQVIGDKPVPSAAHVPAADIETALKDILAQNRNDIPVLTMNAGSHNIEVAVAQMRRPTSGNSHDAVTEMYYVLEGGGTHVSGGTLVNPRKSVSEMAGPGLYGDGIQGGTARRVVKGDYIIIPAGTPHAWTELDGGRPVSYLDIRVDPNGILKPLGKRRLK
jgi:mannose-6-phosphate isomerase-like protein (cupin superfamily)